MSTTRGSASGDPRVEALEGAPDPGGTGSCTSNEFQNIVNTQVLKEMVYMCSKNCCA